MFLLGPKESRVFIILFSLPIDRWRSSLKRWCAIVTETSPYTISSWFSGYTAGLSVIVGMSRYRVMFNKTSKSTFSINRGMKGNNFRIFWKEYHDCTGVPVVFPLQDYLNLHWKGYLIFWNAFSIQRQICNLFNGENPFMGCTLRVLAQVIMIIVHLPEENSIVNYYINRTV